MVLFTTILPASRRDALWVRDDGFQLARTPFLPRVPARVLARAPFPRDDGAPCDGRMVR